MLQVFWGLLACEILNGKSRDIVENTSLLKMRALIEDKYGSFDLPSSAINQEMNNLASVILHYILVFSFTAKDLSNTALFASLLTDETSYGSVFLHVVQSKPQILLKYMISAFLIARG
jgi:capsid portal protein